MEQETNWKRFASNFLRAELKRKDVTYISLAEKLNAMGINESKASLGLKITRGTFSFAFFLQCMKAINTERLFLNFEEAERHLN